MYSHFTVCRRLPFSFLSVQLFCSWCFCSYPPICWNVIDATKFFQALGKRVRSLREGRGFIQEDMISFGFSARHWQQIEKGRPITVTTLLRITLALNYPLHKLVRGLPKPALVAAQEPKELSQVTRAAVPFPHSK